MSIHALKNKLYFSQVKYSISFKDYMNESIPDITFRVIEGRFINRHTSGMWADSGPHADPFSRLYYIDGGKGVVEYAGRTYELSAGNYYLFPARYPILHHSSPGLVHYYVHFTAHMPGAFSLFDMTEWECETPVADRRKACETMLRMIKLPESPADLLQRQAALLEVVAGFMKRFTGEDNRGARRFARVVEYIHRHLEENISLAQLARLSSLHPNYFSNLFTEALGVSPREYMMRKRIERAQMLLWRTDMSIKQVADAAGCEESAYFCRVFKQRTGMTPGQYRRQRVKV